MFWEIFEAVTLKGKCWRIHRGAPTANLHHQEPPYCQSSHSAFSPRSDLNLSLVPCILLLSEVVNLMSTTYNIDPGFECVVLNMSSQYALAHILAPAFVRFLTLAGLRCRSREEAFRKDGTANCLYVSSSVQHWYLTWSPSRREHGHTILEPTEILPS